MHRGEIPFSLNFVYELSESLYILLHKVERMCWCDSDSISRWSGAWFLEPLTIYCERLVCIVDLIIYTHCTVSATSWSTNSVWSILYCLDLVRHNLACFRLLSCKSHKSSCPSSSWFESGIVLALPDNLEIQACGKDFDLNHCNALLGHHRPSSTCHHPSSLLPNPTYYRYFKQRSPLPPHN